MDQRQVFSNLQTSMGIGDTNDNALGGLVIVSALFTEFALLGIIDAEEDKIRAALDVDVTAEELADVDSSVAKVLEEVCCIEKQVVKKIELGIDTQKWKEKAMDLEKDLEKDMAMEKRNLNRRVQLLIAKMKV